MLQWPNLVLPRLRLAAVAVLISGAALALAACGGDDAPRVDGGTDAGDAGDGGRDGAISTDGPAQIPWLAEGRPPVAPPTMTPCPAGWREYAGPDGIARCSPYAEAGPDTCAAVDEAHFPGAPGCQRIGPACPAVGGFAEGLPTDGTVVYVREGAAAGGDGTLAAPYRSLREAGLATQSPGTTVAMAAGDYFAGDIVPTGVTLVGACVAGTTVRYLSGGGSSQAILTVEAPDVTLRSFRMVGGLRRGLFVNGPSASVTLDAIVIEDALLTGIYLHDSAGLTATDISIRDTQTIDGEFGRALSVELGSTAHVTRADFAGSSESAVVSRGASGATPSSVHLEDILVRDTHLDATGRSRSVNAELGGHLEAYRAYFTRTARDAARLSGADSSLLLEDVVIDGAGRAGIAARGGTLTATRTDIQNTHVTGITVNDDAAATLSDLIIINTRIPEGPHEPEGFGGVFVYAGTVALARAFIDGNMGTGFTAQGPATDAQLEDIWVRGSIEVPGEEGAGTGTGITAIAGSNLALTRGLVEDNVAVGINTGLADTHVTLTDVAILGTVPNGAGRYGYGLSSIFTGTVEAARLLVANSRGVGIFAAELGTALTLEDTVVLDVAPQPCPDCGALEDTAFGVGSYREAAVTLSRFQVARAGICGVQLAQDAALDLSEGQITDNDIGACVQVDGYDLDRLTDRVVYDNGTNLDSTTLPIPGISGVSPTD